MYSKDYSNENREYPRNSVIALIRVFQIAYKGYSYNGKIFNISPKGMYIETDAPLAGSELFKAKIIQSQELAEGDSALCGVVWLQSIQDLNSGPYGYGVQFVRAPPSVYLSSWLSQPAIPSKKY